MGSMVDMPIRSAPIAASGFSLIVYTDSRKVGYEDQVKTDKDRKARGVMMDGGKIAPEVFDKAFTETPKAFYLQAEKDIDASLEIVAKMDVFCDEKFEDDSPGFGKLKTALMDVRHVVHQLLEKKREKEPDPVEEVLVEEVALADGTSSGEGVAGSITGIGGSFAAEPTDRRQAVMAIGGAAAFLPKREPFSPPP